MNTPTITVHLTQQEFDLVSQSIDLHLGAAKKYLKLNSNQEDIFPSFLKGMPDLTAILCNSSKERVAKEKKEADELTLLSAKLVEAKRRAEYTAQTNQGSERP